MSIKAGDRLPEGKFKVMTESGPKDLTTAELFNGKRVVLFAVPGAFTPTCDAKHLPGYLGLADQLRGKGVDTIACMAVNDVFVMNAWGKASGVRRQGADAGRRQRRLRACPRAGARCPRLRHGHARPALCARGRQWRRHARERRGAGPVQGLGRRERAGAAISDRAAHRVPSLQAAARAERELAVVHGGAARVRFAHEHREQLSNPANRSRTCATRSAAGWRAARTSSSGSGYEIISLNIGNPRLFGFRTPGDHAAGDDREHVRERGLLPPEGHLPGARSGGHAAAGARRQRGQCRGSVHRQRRQRADRPGAARAAQRRR